MMIRIFLILTTVVLFKSCNDNSNSNTNIYDYVGNFELYEDGQTMRRIAIKPGDEDQIWELDFYNNGQLMSIYEIKNGRLFGIRIVFDKHGSILELGKVKYGVPVGKWYTFNKDGEISVVNDY